MPSCASDAQFYESLMPVPALTSCPCYRIVAANVSTAVRTAGFTATGLPQASLRSKSSERLLTIQVWAVSQAVPFLGATLDRNPAKSSKIEKCVHRGMRLLELMRFTCLWTTFLPPSSGRCLISTCTCPGARGSSSEQLERSCATEEPSQR